jgi:hypothetical protein
MAWEKSALKHSQTFPRARFEFMDMLKLHNNCRGRWICLVEQNIRATNASFVLALQLKHVHATYADKLHFIVADRIGLSRTWALAFILIRNARVYGKRTLSKSASFLLLLPFRRFSRSCSLLFFLFRIQISWQHLEISPKHWPKALSPTVSTQSTGNEQTLQLRMPNSLCVWTSTRVLFGAKYGSTTL